MAERLTVSELAAVFQERPLFRKAVAAFLHEQESHRLPECRKRVQAFGRAFLYSLEEGEPLPVEPRCICGDL